MSNKEGLDVESVKSFVDSLFKLYSQNSFGSVSKRELDLFLFSRFKELGLIEGESSWKIAQELKISKTKAQTLLYESELRYGNQLDSKEKIKKILQKIPNSFEKETVSLIVDNRYVRDCMREFLANKDFVTDLSFASDVVKMPIDAYWVLQEEYNPTAVKSLEKEWFVNNLKKLGKTALSSFISSISSEALGQTAEKTVSSFFKYFQKKYKGAEK